MMKESIQATSTKMDVINEREKRKNNIILYNMSEKENIKESVNKLLKEISGTDLGTEVVEISRLGKKSDEEKSRPVLVQFSNYTVKNLILNNCAKLKKSLNFNKVIINHDFSREDRISNRKILEEKKKEIGEKDDVSKWSFRLKGVPGDFYVIAFKKQNLLKSPNSNVGNNDLLLKLINDVLALPGETLMFGDFNFPDINWDTSSCEGNDERVENRFLDLLKDKFLIQHINHPARFRDGNSDHSILEFKVTGFCCSAMECDKKYCFDLSDYINFRNALGVSLQCKN
ncbi:hypothetical protein HELRODRAFT_168139 [Helobdella robusta]|uniref:Uncharacterized protein n=1 Tax=Helobdella robusta TaxID=6412 RepID=T1F078_HELRO|nr:hypothetical protein HELRODRAFT_168139 [Helobdella robusta]ESO10249.1 hypothetical protein HELRODRAFT_168139 [Helobdella robusta]